MLPADLAGFAEAAGFAPDSARAEDVAVWLLTVAQGEAPAAASRYLYFLKSQYETFHAIEECFPRSGGSGGIGTSPEELLHIANHLYHLDAAGIAGIVLECGCFKGFSSACLSHACGFLGRDLVTADSFAGLPATAGRGEEGYRPGDFRGARAEVEANVRLFGRWERVRFLEGWFRDSLPGLEAPVALLWMDVDLYASVRDVLEAALALLDPKGAIFSHEFLPSHVDPDGRIVYDQEPPGAVRDIFAARGEAIRAVHLAGWLARIDREQAVGRGAEGLLRALLPHLRDLDHRARAARSAIGVRPALRDWAKRRFGR